MLVVVVVGEFVRAGEFVKLTVLRQSQPASHNSNPQRLLAGVMPQIPRVSYAAVKSSLPDYFTADGE